MYSQSYTTTILLGGGGGGFVPKPKKVFVTQNSLCSLFYKSASYLFLLRIVIMITFNVSLDLRLFKCKLASARKAILT